MKNPFKATYKAIIAVFFLYLIPIIFLTYYEINVLSSMKGWNLFSVGLFISSVGSLILFWLINNQINISEPMAFSMASDSLTRSVNLEEEIEPTEELSLAPPTILQRASEFTEEYVDELKLKIEELKRDNLVHQSDVEQVFQDFTEYKISSEAQLEKLENQIVESQQTISDQRMLLEKKQQHVNLLENKVRDLTYEIKTLLQLAEVSTSSIDQTEPAKIDNNPFEEEEFISDSAKPLQDTQVYTEEHASQQLRRCLDIAQKITGANHYSSGTSRFRELSTDNYALDLRRLFDCLRNESTSCIVFYSSKENKLLFANNQIKNLLGWSPEAFVQDFSDIIEKSMVNWRNALSQLSLKNEVKVQLSMKTKSDLEVPINGILGIISTGIFRNHVIGILYDFSSTQSFK